MEDKKFLKKMRETKYITPVDMYPVNLIEEENTKSFFKHFKKIEQI